MAIGYMGGKWSEKKERRNVEGFGGVHNEKKKKNLNQNQNIWCAPLEFFLNLNQNMCSKQTKPLQKNNNKKHFNLRTY